MTINNHLSSNQKDTGLDLTEKRERVFLVLAAFFICAMTLLNILGITRFVQLGPLQLAIGVLPYPLTFLCTDLICELYGRARASFVVTIGLILNIFILSFLFIANLLPSAPNDTLPPWQVIQLAENISLPSGKVFKSQVELFQLIYQCTSGAVFASMLAYLLAQYTDVRIFHYLKKLTKGKHLWIRNNGSTLISQLIDSIVVIAVTFGTAILAGDFTIKAVMVLIGSNYLFKMIVALIDTVPFYLLVAYLSRYLKINTLDIK